MISYRSFKLIAITLSAVFVAAIADQLTASTALIGMYAVNLLTEGLYTLIESPRRRTDGRVIGAPGRTLLKATDALCHRSTAELVGEMVADMRLEYFDALKAGRRGKAEWIRFLYLYSVARALSIDRLVGWAARLVWGISSK